MLVRRSNAAFIDQDWEAYDRGAQHDNGQTPNDARPLPTTFQVLVFLKRGPGARPLAGFQGCPLTFHLFPPPSGSTKKPILESSLRPPLHCVPSFMSWTT